MSLVFAYGIDGQDTNYNTRKISDSDARAELTQRYDTSSICFCCAKDQPFSTRRCSRSTTLRVDGELSRTVNTRCNRHHPLPIPMFLRVVHVASRREGGDFCDTLMTINCWQAQLVQQMLIVHNLAIRIIDLGRRGKAFYLEVGVLMALSVRPYN
ncbi:hypothetical protein [Nostoc sp.]|uniref:hypothetical protein n=1 Tax=Nostoc sp. TaxID=1180 RepID=UPI002FF4C2CE